MSLVRLAGSIRATASFAARILSVRWSTTMYARASTCGAVGMVIGPAVGAGGVSAKLGWVANAMRKTQARRERSIVDEYLGRDLWGSRLSHGALPWTLVEREMCIVDAGPLQRGDHAVELRDAGHGPDAYPIHSAARDLIVAHGDLAIAAAAQFLRQAFRICGVGERAGLYEQRGGGGCGARDRSRARRCRRCG